MVMTGKWQSRARRGKYLQAQSNIFSGKQCRRRARCDAWASYIADPDPDAPEPSVVPGCSSVRWMWEDNPDARPCDENECPYLLADDARLAAALEVMTNTPAPVA